MAFREVSMLEVKEILRQWMSGASIKQIAARVGADRKTVRRYIRAAQKQGVQRKAGEISAEVLAGVVGATQSRTKPSATEGWQQCLDNRERIQKLLHDEVRLTKIVKLFARDGVTLSYWTLRRFAHRELGFSQTKATLPVMDGEPGSELQIDTGWVIKLTADASGKCKRLRAFIFTPNVSRYRFVYPIEHETTAEAIAACDAAWEFYGGVFGVLVPDNTKAIVNVADSLSAQINITFLEYSQARGFVIDPARSGRPKDKPRVERAVRDVRDDCYGGEVLATIERARVRGEYWSREEYGMRKHSTTQRLPKEHFETDERPHLLPAPTQRYDTPIWCDPKVAPDQLAQVAKSLYSLPTQFVGRRLRARADSGVVRFYDNGALVKTHLRVAPGKRSLDRLDYPAEKSAYAMRDVNYLAATAREHGEHVGSFAERLLAGDLPWTKMRRVRKLLSLAKKYGDARLEQSCAIALEADMLDVRRLENMLALAVTESQKPLAKIIPIGRYLRPTAQYALPLQFRDADETKGDK